MPLQNFDFRLVYAQILFNQNPKIMEAQTKQRAVRKRNNGQQSKPKNPKTNGNDAHLSNEELVAQFKESFKKETFYKLLRFLLTRQVHLGESNHTNNLTNRSFYVAMQSFYKDKI